MQRIPLEVYEFAGSLRAMVHFLLKIEGIQNYIPIRAIVDTGSPTTLIGPLDTKRMRISPIKLKSLEGRHKPINIGGGEIIAKVLEKSRLKFRDGFEIEMPVDFPIKEGKNQFQPSLLGVDFLLKTKAKLFFDPSNKVAYFEIEE